MGAGRRGDHWVYLGAGTLVAVGSVGCDHVEAPLTVRAHAAASASSSVDKAEASAGSTSEVVYGHSRTCTSRSRSPGVGLPSGPLDGGQAGLHVVDVDDHLLIR